MSLLLDWFIRSWQDITVPCWSREINYVLLKGGDRNRTVTAAGVPKLRISCGHCRRRKLNSYKTGQISALIHKSIKMLNLLSCFLPTTTRKRARTSSLEELDAKSDFGTFIPIGYPSKQRFCRFAKKNIPIRRDRKNIKKRNISTTSIPRAQQISRQRRSEMFNLRDRRIIPKTNNQITLAPVKKTENRYKTYI